MRNGKKILLIPFTLQILLVFAWAVLADLQGENSYFLIPKTPSQTFTPDVVS